MLDEYISPYDYLKRRTPIALARNSCIVYEGGIKIGLNASEGIPTGRGRAARIACLDLMDSSASGSELATICGVHEDERRAKNGEHLL